MAELQDDTSGNKPKELEKRPDPRSLPDDAIVVRGGEISSSSLIDGCAHHDGVHGFSVQSELDRQVRDLVQAGGIPHSKIGVTSVRTLRDLGYDVVKTRGKGFHATVVVPENFDEKKAGDVAKAFSVKKNEFRRI